MIIGQGRKKEREKRKLNSNLSASQMPYDSPPEHRLYTEYIPWCPFSVNSVSELLNKRLDSDNSRTAIVRNVTGRAEL